MDLLWTVGWDDDLFYPRCKFEMLNVFLLSTLLSTTYSIFEAYEINILDVQS